MACTRSLTADLTALTIVSYDNGNVIRLVWRITSSRSGGFVTIVSALLRLLLIYYNRGVVYTPSLKAYVGDGLVVGSGVAVVAGGDIVAARSTKEVTV